jgi:hypothetical protein
MILIAAWILALTGFGSAGAQDVPTDGTTYTLTVYNSDPAPAPAFEESHPLSNTLNTGWSLFNTNYRRVNVVATGLSGQTVEIRKPAIYNAVIKADRFIRRAVDKGDLPRQEAVATLRHILECANAFVSKNDTLSFEREIAGARTPESIIRIFNQVKLEYI